MFKKHLLVVVALASMFMLSGCDLLNSVSLDKLPKYSQFYDKEANATEDLQKAMEQAVKSNKKILVMLGGDWCKWCGNLDNLLESNEEVTNKFYSSFEVVKVHFGRGMSEGTKNMLKAYPKVTTVPHFFILDKDAKLLVSYSTVALERGDGYNKAKVLEFIETHK
jgi:thioredoxin-related protein